MQVTKEPIGHKGARLTSQISLPGRYLVYVPDGSMTGRQALWHAVELVPAGLLPWAIGLGGRWYFAGAMALGLFYLYHAARFWWDVNDRSVKRLLRASFVYLPLILLLLLLDAQPLAV